MSDYFYRPQIATIPLLQVKESSATMDRSRFVDPDKLKKVIKTLLNMPNMKVPQAGVVRANVGQNVTPHNPSLGLFLYHFLHTMSS